MSQNSRRQELLSRLKTTLAIVSQATGFDSNRPVGDARPAEQQQWNSPRDPRLRKLDTYHEGSRVAEPVDSTVSASSASSNTAHRKVEEIQDEDEFLYGSGIPGTQQVTDSKRIDDQQSGRLRNEDQQAGRQQWSAQRTREDEAQHWSTQRPSVSHHTSYVEPPQPAAHRDVDSRWMGSMEPPARSGQSVSDQSRWMQTTAQRSDEQSWGASSVQTMRYSDIDKRQPTGRGDAQVAPGNTGTLPEPTTSRLQGTNAGMLEGILKLVASGTASTASQPLVSQQAPVQQPPQPQIQQPVYERQNVYGSTYPQQNVYIQSANQQGYASSGIPSGGMAYGQQRNEFQQSSYDYGQPAPRPSTDLNSLLVSQLSSTLLNRNVGQVPSQPVTDHVQRLAEVMRQYASRNQNQSQFPFRLGGAGTDSQFTTPSASQPLVPQQQFTQQPQPAMTAIAPPQAPQPQVAITNPYSFVAAPAVVSQPAMKEPHPWRCWPRLYWLQA